MPNPSSRIAVIIATKGRSDQVRALLPFLNAQSLRPAEVILAITERKDADFDLSDHLADGISGKTVIAPRGLTKQRNAGLDALGGDIETVVFFDDDFLPSRFALEVAAQALAAWPDVSGLSGHLLADGIHSSGVALEDATRMVADWDDAHSDPASRALQKPRRWDGLYGCNMVMRRSALDGLRFDERLPAYGWLEDLDLTHQLPGRTVICKAMAGVHLGTKTGRETNGARLGYSQVVNPFYLYQKGTVSAYFLVERVGMNIVANTVKSLRSEPWINRKARLQGNLIGLRDVLAGRADPGRIEHWDQVSEVALQTQN